VKGLLVVIAASGLLIGLSVISYTQQAGVPPGGITAASGSAAQFGTGPANGGGVVVRRAPTPGGSGDGEPGEGTVGRGRDATDPRSGNGRCKTQIYQVPSVDTGKLTSVSVMRC
jgi:hypothetical protein